MQCWNTCLFCTFSNVPVIKSHNTLALQLTKSMIEVRHCRTGYFIPVRYGPGVWPDGRVGGTPPPTPSPSLPSVGNSDPKCVNVESCSEIPRSGRFHSVRLVKLVSKNSTQAKVSGMFGPKNNFHIKKFTGRLKKHVEAGPGQG